MMVRFANLSYHTENLGDDVQSIACLPFVGQNPEPLDRDTLALQERDEKYILIMNGWWADQPTSAFPPAACIIPVFIGFHIAAQHTEHFLKPHCLEYFKKHQPIGCRDAYTTAILQQHGIDAFFSGCLSTSFEKIEGPDNGKIYLVDAERIDYLIPDEIRQNATRLTHRFAGNDDARNNAVKDLLDAYRNKPSLVITTRLHAALPCSAMGIPVVLFFHPDDPRASTATQIGLRIYKPYLVRPHWIKNILVRSRTTNLWTYYEQARLAFHYKFFEKINWNPEPLDFEEHKKKIIRQTKDKIQYITVGENP